MTCVSERLDCPASQALAALRPSLVGLTRAGLAEAMAAVGVPERERRMRVAQLWHRIYFQGATSFDAMLNVSKTAPRETAASMPAAPGG